jgi:uncharacterized membrane protein YjjP (DUF1212 family)|tara:strand:+ start:1357 stop:1494 length:138 start_codon:yes stop_codon:yes gene_type:complete
MIDYNKYESFDQVVKAVDNDEISAEEALGDLLKALLNKNSLTDEG